MQSHPSLASRLLRYISPYTNYPLFFGIFVLVFPLSFLLLLLTYRRADSHCRGFCCLPRLSPSSFVVFVAPFSFVPCISCNLYSYSTPSPAARNISFRLRLCLHFRIEPRTLPRRGVCDRNMNVERLHAQRVDNGQAAVMQCPRSSPPYRRIITRRLSLSPPATTRPPHTYLWVYVYSTAPPTNHQPPSIIIIVIIISLHQTKPEIMPSWLYLILFHIHSRLLVSSQFARYLIAQPAVPSISISLPRSPRPLSLQPYKIHDRCQPR